MPPRPTARPDVAPGPTRKIHPQPHPVDGVDRFDQLTDAFYAVFVEVAVELLPRLKTRWVLVALFPDEASAKRDALTLGARHPDAWLGPNETSAPFVAVRRVGVTVSVGDAKEINLGVRS